MKKNENAKTTLKNIGRERRRINEHGINLKRDLAARYVYLRFIHELLYNSTRISFVQIAVFSEESMIPMAFISGSYSFLAFVCSLLRVDAYYEGYMSLGTPKQSIFCSIQ